MANSQNGWPVVTKSKCDQGPFEGVTFPNGILAGDVATIARWQLRRYKALVEPLKQGTCWGWFDRNVIGSSTKSNHASATAWDINADEHNIGDEPSVSFSAHQIAGCRQIVHESAGVLRWGGDYSGRKDPMHWEINCSRSEAAAFAAKIRAGNGPGEEENVDQDDANLVVNTLLAKRIPFPYDPANPTRTVADLLGYGGASISNIANQVDATLKGRFDALAAGQEQDDVDEAAIASNVLAGLTSEKLGQAMTAAGLTPAAIAAAIPPGIARQVIDELDRRLTAGSGEQA